MPNKAVHTQAPPPVNTPGAISMRDLKVGQSCIVRQIGGQGALRRRLLDMGLTPGTRVLLYKTAPMGDPMELHLRGYDLSLRRDDAADILVEVEA